MFSAFSRWAIVDEAVGVGGCCGSVCGKATAAANRQAIPSMKAGSSMDIHPRYPARTDLRNRCRPERLTVRLAVWIPDARGLHIGVDHAVPDVHDAMGELGNIRLVSDQHDGVAARMQLIE